MFPMIRGMKTALHRTPATGPRVRGRPREFEMDEALDKAIQIFCQRGYHGTSIAELGEAMGLTAGSIYKAFKDKRAVFLAAFDRQASMRGAQLAGAIDAATTGRDKLQRTLAFYASLSHGAEGQHGCLVVSTAVELAAFDEEVAERAVNSLQRREKLLRKLVQLGQADGSIPPHVDSQATAKFMLCLLQGLRVVGKTAPSRASMVSAVEVAMKVLD